MKILVVDDDVDTTELLAMLLERHGYDVKIASSLLEARASLAQNQYDVLITDLHLTDGQGTSLLEPTRPKNLRAAILVTGAGEEEQRRASRDLGFDRCLTKPVDVNQIISRLESLFSHGHAT